MTTRTFCLLIVTLLLALSAGTVIVIRGISVEEQEVKEAFVASKPIEYLKSPTGSWQETAVFGAQYSEQYGQWSYRDDIAFDMQANAPVYAPMSGTVVRVEEAGESGSCVVLQCGEETEIGLQPVYGLRIFKGSKVKQGDVIGEGRGSVSLKVWKAGRIVDPLTLADAAKSG